MPPPKGSALCVCVCVHLQPSFKSSNLIHTCQLVPAFYSSPLLINTLAPNSPLPKLYHIPVMSVSLGPTFCQRGNSLAVCCVVCVCPCCFSVCSLLCCKWGGIGQLFLSVLSIFVFWRKVNKEVHVVGVLKVMNVVCQGMLTSAGPEPATSLFMEVSWDWFLLGNQL